MAISNKQLEIAVIYRRAILGACAKRKHTVAELELIIELEHHVHRSTLNAHLDDMLRRKWLHRSIRVGSKRVGPKPYEYALTELGRWQASRIFASPEARHAGPV